MRSGRLALRSPEHITVTATGLRFVPEIEAAYYYCCLEAVQNASKHAGADVKISIRLSAGSGELQLEVSDNAAGFNPAAAHDGLELESMRDRLGAVGGSVEIDSQPGRGTVVIAGAPIGRHSGQAAPVAPIPGKRSLSEPSGATGDWSRSRRDDHHAGSP